MAIALQDGKRGTLRRASPSTPGLLPCHKSALVEGGGACMSHRKKVSAAALVRTWRSRSKQTVTLTSTLTCGPHQRIVFKVLLDMLCTYRDCRVPAAEGSSPFRVLDPTSLERQKRGKPERKEEAGDVRHGSQVPGSSTPCILREFGERAAWAATRPWLLGSSCCVEAAQRVPQAGVTAL